MPVEEHDDEGRQPAPSQEGDTPTPPPAGGESAAARRRRRGWRRVVNRRNAAWTAVVAVVAVVAIVLIAIILYRTGKIDRVIAGQIVGTLAKYNVRAEIGHFETKFDARTVELRDLKLYNSVTGAQIGNIDRVLAKIRIEDLWALNLTRNISLEEMIVDHPELWVVFDEQGRSNFQELRLPPPETNKRIVFAYSTALVRVNGAVLHYDDDRYELTGDARNVVAFIRPEDPNAPESSRANLLDLSLSDSTFTYQGRPVENISLELKARADQVRADIRELVLRSPVTEARLSGALDDWRNLRYRLNVNATTDLTRASDVLQLGTTLRGGGRFEGVVSGEGDKYKVEGQIVSDALAADNIRLQGLNVNATASGQGKSYEAQGKAVAELLTAGDYQISKLQLAGGVTGTGTDFRWLGDLRAAAARSGANSVAGLFLHDAVLEMRDEKLAGSAASANVGNIVAEGARVAGAQASGVRFERDADGTTRASVDSARAGSVVASGAQISGAQASDVKATINPDNSADVNVGRVTVAGLNAAGARTGSLNIAGVRLAVSSGGRVEGTSGDVNVGTVAFRGGVTGKGGEPAEGRVENVRLARPRFTLEPGGRYRASADLSLGGGVLGEMRLGAARAAVVASNDQIQLNDFTADIFQGRARGSAVIATTGRATSQVRASFENVDAGGLIAMASGRAVPLTGAATGTVDLRFPGTNFRAASGRLDAQFTGATGRDESARTPLTGELAVAANQGDFRVERANLRAGATELSASGRFSFSGGSDLAVNLNSADAAELQAVALSTGLLPDIETAANNFGVQLGGSLRFNGTLTGDFDNPSVNGRFELASLALNGRTIGALSADLVSNASETRIDNGRLAEPDGGGATFAAVIPRTGENNVSFEATLDNANAGNLLAAAGLKQLKPEAVAGLGAASGRVSVTGYPGAMQGSADLRVAAGRIGNQPYESAVARATFNGRRVQLETAELRLTNAGRITAAGALEYKGERRGLPVISAEGLRVEGRDVQLSLVNDLFGAGRGLPALSGVADFTATASGADIVDFAALDINLDAKGRDVAVNGQPAGELTLKGRKTEDQKFVLELTTGLLGRPQVLTATLDLAGEEGITLDAGTTLTGADLTPLFATLLNNPDVRVTGRATGSLRLKGSIWDDEHGFTTAGLQGRAEFSELTVQVMDVPLTAENPLVILFTPSQVTFERTRFTGPGTNLSFGGTAAIGA
ncbi:MAG TPA: YdbH domain-containing protein, partial [Pyrinomonadaceae bacterium]|nr:YdbH domain-containing protein [Pyrinomonadaceae bacterium]